MVLEPRQGRGVTKVEVTLFSKQLSMQQPLGVFSGQHRPIIGPGRGAGVANTLRLEPEDCLHAMLPSPVAEGSKALGEFYRIRLPETGGVEED